MTVETPIEMSHLPQNIRDIFTGLLPEASFGTQEEKEKNFLSRALARRQSRDSTFWSTS